MFKKTHSPANAGIKNLMYKASATFSPVKAWAAAHTAQTVAIAAGVVLATGGVGAGVAYSQGAFDPAPQTHIVASHNDEKSQSDLKLKVTADDGWSKDSTPAIAHIKSNDDNAVDFYHAVNADKDGNKGSSKVTLAEGDYTVSFVSPLNSDGSAYDIYDTGKPVNIKVSKDSDENCVNCPMTKIPADKVTDDMVKDIINKTKDAIKGGDESLKGDAGKDILDKLDHNTSKNPNASDDTKKDASDAGKDSGVNDAPASTTPATDKTDKGNTGSTGKTDFGNKGSNNSGSTNTNAGSSNTNNASSGNQQSETKPAHVHKWVDHIGTFTIYETEEIDVPDYADQQVAVGTKYTFSADGYVTTNDADAENHAYQLITNGQDSYYQTETIYETRRVQVGSHKESRPTSHNVTRADFKYCEECGAIEYYQY